MAEDGLAIRQVGRLLTRVNSSATLLIPAAAGINQLRKDSEMEKKILTASLRNGLFGDRGGDVIAALEYAHEVINAIPNSSERAPTTRALHVVLNTVANAIDALELPADSPAAGVTGFEDALIKLIDARIKYCLDDMDLTSDMFTLWHSLRWYTMRGRTMLKS